MPKKEPDARSETAETRANKEIMLRRKAEERSKTAEARTAELEAQLAGRKQFSKTHWRPVFPILPHPCSLLATIVWAEKWKDKVEIFACDEDKIYFLGHWFFPACCIELSIRYSAWFAKRLTRSILFHPLIPLQLWFGICWWVHMCEGITHKNFST